MPAVSEPYEVLAARRRTTLMDMATALRAAGVNPDDVGQVVTHAHYDHIGRLPAFGAAEVSPVVNLADMYAAFDQIREMEQDAGTRVIAGHDPVVAARFPAFHGQDGVFLLSGLAKPRNGTER